jgi:ATP-binding cassette subfamily B protein
MTRLNTIRTAFAEYAWRLGLLGVISLVTVAMEVAALGLLIAAVAAVSNAEGVYTGVIPIVETSIAWSADTLLWICLIIIILRTVAQVFGAYLSTRTATEFEARQRRGLLTAFLHASWDCQSRERSGQMQVLMTNNVEAASKALTNLSIGLSSVVSFAILTASAFAIDWRCAFGVLVVAALLFFTIRPISGKSHYFARRKLDSRQKFVYYLSQGMAQTKELRVFGVADTFGERVSHLIGKFRRFRSAQLFLSAIVPVIYQNASVLIVLGGLSIVYVSDATQIDSLSFVVLLLLRAMTYGQNLQVYHHAISEGLPYLEELLAAEQEYGRNILSTAGKPIERVDSLVMEQVRFAYHPAETVLNDVSFSVEHGEMIGIVGPSGSGKTTLMQLLLRLREPQQGRFLINGEPSDAVAFSSWFQRAAFVPQESVMFNESIRDCIRFYRPDIDDERIYQAARQAGVYDDIAAFVEGFDTLAGERGGNLSGGQRQRVCIARALAGRPDVIIFDEPTSALDVHSETRVLETLAALKGRVTVFIIAHRLSTLNICDKVMVLRHGRIQAFDAPGALAEHDPYYVEALRLAQVH